MTLSGSRTAIEALLRRVEALRWEIGRDYHERIVEAIYGDAKAIADRAVTPSEDDPRASFDATLDRFATSRIWGFPIMLALLMVVFWITIVGANVPSDWLARLLLGTIHPALIDS